LIASNVSRPVPPRTSFATCSYMASKPPCTDDEFLPARIEKSARLEMASAGALPCSTRGMFDVIETARKSDFCGSDLLCKYRLSQPSVVDFTPGVADSM